MKKIITLSTIIVSVILFIKCNNADNSSKKNEVAKSQDTANTQETCLADSAWFPITSPPLNFNPDSLGECGFYKWAWQEFLYITQPEKEGQLPRFLTYETPRHLFGPIASPLFAAKNTNNALLLAPRLEKDSVFTSLDEIGQAGFDEAHYLVDQNGRIIYYAQHINDTFADFIRKNDFTNMNKLVNAPETLKFPKGSLELKSSWKVVLPGEDVSTYFTIDALVEQLTVGKDPQGNSIFVVDPNVKPKPQKVALLGLHVVGVVDGHPEFIWATFEHSDLAPNLDTIGTDPEAALPLNNDPKKKYLLYKTGSLAKDCNKTPPLMLDVKTQTFSPITSAFHEFAFDETATRKNQDEDIVPLNADVHARLVAAKSKWQNYTFKGAVWIDSSQKYFLPKKRFPASLLKGEKALSNVTMETFTQSTSNCFSCHRTIDEKNKVNDLSFPGKLLSISHIVTNAYFNTGQHKIKAEQLEILKKKLQNK